MQHLLVITICLLLTQTAANAQPMAGTQSRDTLLTLPQALRIAVANYPRLKAAQNIANASALEVKAARQDGLPDLVVGIQTAYGTLDGSNGLSNGVPGLTT